MPVGRCGLPGAHTWEATDSFHGGGDRGAEPKGRGIRAAASLRMLGPIPDLMSQDPHPNKISRGFVCTEVWEMLGQTSSKSFFSIIMALEAPPARASAP